jgi:hypothetical protein
MAAIVGYLLGEEWTRPAIAGLVITSDGFLLARDPGSVGYDRFIGEASDLTRNLEDLADAADLTPDERADLAARYRARVSDWRTLPPDPRGQDPDPDPESEPGTLGPCGCVEYHLADCPLRAPDRYPPDDDPDGWGPEGAD